MSTAAAIKKRKNKFRKFQEKRSRACCKDMELIEIEGEKCKLVDYKFIEPLQKLVTAQGKMFSRKRGGNSAQCQTLVKLAVKRARFLGLMPYVG
jgi:small subunit ribosomal protein S18